MAESINSQSLSALTEGQNNIATKLPNRKEIVTSYLIDGSVTVPPSTSSPNGLKYRTSSNRVTYTKRNKEHFLRSENSTLSSKSYLKRQFLTTESNALDSKKRRINNLNKKSTPPKQNTLVIIDCVAHRTRSKTLLPRINPVFIESNSISEVIDKGVKGDTPESISKPNLFKYYRKTRSVSRKHLKNSVLKLESPTSLSKVVPSAQQNRSFLANSKNTQNKNFNITFDSNKKERLEKPKNKLPRDISSVSLKININKKLDRKNKTFPSSRKSQSNTFVSTEYNGDQTVDKSKVPSNETNYYLMAQQLEGTSANTVGNQPTPDGSSSTSGTTSASTNTSGIVHADSESDDSEVGRLQALLEARGLPPHLFGALGPRMTHILHRTIGSSSSSKAHQLLQGLQCGDESQQLQAVIELCQMLVMGNEDTLAGFPIKQVVPTLITLLRMEHNFDIMNNACRALAYMLEALPRSSGTVVEAIPVFLEKLQVIQCMDVAEQSLTALEILSRRHNKAILQAGGISACLTYLDFFSINAQRAALSTTANCCLNLHSDEFYLISESMTLLARLLSQQDKKCVESVCTTFSRLVESFQYDSSRLQEIASNDLLKNCQRLLVMSPSILNTNTFTSVVRMLSLMCSSCPDLAVLLLRNDIESTLLYLLTGATNSISSKDVELVTRSPSELFEITCLIEELMPRLPADNIFAVDALVDRPNHNSQDEVEWQWRDDRGSWNSYSAIDSQIIDAAHINSDDEINLSTLGRTYTVDFHSMQQVNDDTGTTRPVQRKVNTNCFPNLSSTNFVFTGQDLSTSTNRIFVEQSSNRSPILSNSTSMQKSIAFIDARIDCLKEEGGLASQFIRNIFNVLYEIYSSSAGPNVRYKCLRALLRMVYYAGPDLLKIVLKKQTFSSHIAGMLASNDLRIVVGALQMAEILMQKLPKVFGTHFRREGVLYQINQLADSNTSICGSFSAASPSTSQNKHFPVESNNLEASTSKSHWSHHTHFCQNINSSPASKIGISKPYSSSSNSFQDVHSPKNRMPSKEANVVFSEADPVVPNVGIVDHYSNTMDENSRQVVLGSSSIKPEKKNAHSTKPSGFCQHHLQHSSVPHFQSVCYTNTTAYSSDVEPSNSIPISSSAGVTLAIQSKVSDILKRKVPPKRKSQPTNRSKPRQDESTVQDLIHGATGMAGISNSGRVTPTSNAANTRSRVSGSASSGTSTKPSFLSSLNPARWGRQGSQNSSFTKDSSSPTCVTSNINKTISNANLVAANNREKARQWVRNQANSFANRYSEHGDSKSITSDASILSRLSGVILKIKCGFSQCLEALHELKHILMENDISPFEVNHSGLIKSMLNFMTADDGIVLRDDRLRAFLHVFAGLPLENVSIVGDPPNMEPSAFSAFVAKLNACVTQLEQFPVKVHDFSTGAGGRSSTSALKFFNTHQLKCNLQRHPDCNNLRQWKGGTVKIDPLAMVQAIERYLLSRGYGGIRGESDEDSDEDLDDNVSAVVMTHSTFKHKLQFLIGDSVLPYAMTVYQAVKQYSPLLIEQSETENDTEIPLGNASIWVHQHTIYYRPFEDHASVNVGLNNFFDETTRATSSSTSTTALISKKNLGKNSSKFVRKKTELWNEGLVPGIFSPLKPFLMKNFPFDMISVQDASLDALCMLRIVHALNRHWESLYDCVFRKNIIIQTEFIHAKITAKANRQLQDPLVIMTGNLPQWLQQIPVACPFLFPFETRHLLFYTVSFDRDRALQRLLDTTPDLNSVETSERVAPRLDRRKRTISREEILRQAEQIIQDFGHSKALLEIQYENEVGTGLGPTLEFYALVSAELQRSELGLWNGSNSYKTNIFSNGDIIKSTSMNIEGEQRLKKVLHRDEDNVRANIGNENPTSMKLNESIRHNMLEEQKQYSTNNAINHLSNEEIKRFVRDTSLTVAVSVSNYVNPIHGLFPLPFGKSSKLPHISKIKSKFKFLGKFMAKAVMDSRMLDLAFSMPFYRWVLNEETYMGLADLEFVAPEIQRTLVRLQDVVKQREEIRTNPKLDFMEKKEKIELLDLDGCLITDLGLDFVLPGHAGIELRRGGRSIPVTIHNLHQYISLVTHWFLIEGVQKQFEALKEESNMPPTKWKLGRVVEIVKGNDGLVRVANVKTQGGVLQRAIHNLCPLPVEEVDKADLPAYTTEDLKITKTGEPQNLQTSRKLRTGKVTRGSLLVSLFIALLVAPVSTAFSDNRISIEQLDNAVGMYFEDIGTLGSEQLLERLCVLQSDKLLAGTYSNQGLSK